MRNKPIFFLLMVNLITTLTVGYTLYTDDSKDKDYEHFKENVYQAMGMLMSGQSQLSVNQEGLNMALYRVHHFVKPHVELHPNCPECEIDKQKILEEEKDNITADLEGD